MYQKIKNPFNQKWINIKSTLGKRLIKKYLLNILYGGMDTSPNRPPTINRSEGVDPAEGVAAEDDVNLNVPQNINNGDKVRIVNFENDQRFNNNRNEQKNELAHQLFERCYSYNNNIIGKKQLLNDVLSTCDRLKDIDKQFDDRVKSLNNKEGYVISSLYERLQGNEVTHYNRLMEIENSRLKEHHLVHIYSKTTGQFIGPAIVNSDNLRVIDPLSS